MNLISEGVVSTTFKAAFLWMVQGRRQDIKILRLNMKIFGLRKLIKKKISPIMLICVSAVCGMIVYGLL